MNKNSLTSRILFICLIVFPIPFIIDFFLISYLTVRTQNKILSHRLQEASDEFNLKLEKTIYLDKLYLMRIADALGFYKNTLREFPNLSLSENLTDLAIISSDGRLIAKDIADPFIKFIEEETRITANIDEYTKMSSLITIPINSSVNLHYLLTVDYIKPAVTDGLSGYLLGFKNLNNLRQELLSFPQDRFFDLILTDENGIPLVGSKEIFGKERINFDNFSKQKNIDIFSFLLHNENQLGILAKNTRLKNAYTLTFASKTSFITTALRIPLWTLLTFPISLMIIIFFLKRLSRRLNIPLCHLSDCMNAIQNGDYNVRFHVQRFGYEFNRLGRIFNSTLLQLLNSIEESEQETLCKQRVQKETVLIKSIQDQLLLREQTSTTIKIKILDNRDSHSEMVFLASAENDNRCCIGMVGLFDNYGLASCLYAVSVRSLFLTYVIAIKSVTAIYELLSFKINELGIIPPSFCIFEYDPIQKNFKFLSKNPSYFVLHITENNVRIVHENTAVLCTSTSRFFIFLKMPDFNEESIIDHKLSLDSLLREIHTCAQKQTVILIELL
ncbi:MAG: hypothetical protein RR927_02795 [Victivallaceae bacterium]